MAKSLTLHTRVEPEIKEKADAILSELGISITEAINMFLHQVVHYRGIPLDLRLPNPETIAAIEEVQEMKRNPHLYKKFDSVEELFEELDSDD